MLQHKREGTHGRIYEQALSCEATMNPTELMQLAIDKTKEGIAAGQTPFGCAIARGADVIAVSHNVVWSTTDITAHAEVTALREACRNVGQILLDDCIVATTCEPCPMCMSALHWARVQTVYYGATIDDAETAGFNELKLAAADVIKLGNSQIKLVDNVLRDRCIDLFREWKEAGGAAY
jgi:tRNA(Arg) A34 adenosine deaminase TadA